MVHFKLRTLKERLQGESRLQDFDFRAFSKWLVKPNDLVEVHYYIGAIQQQSNNEKSRRMYADQQRLLMNLQKQNINAVLGHLIRHPDKTYTKKALTFVLPLR